MIKLLKTISNILIGILIVCVLMGIVVTPYAYYTRGLIYGTEILMSTGIFGLFLWCLIQFKLEELKEQTNE